MSIDYQWRILDHVCCYDGGRLLQDVNDESHVRCADCGAETGESHRDLCWCGAGDQLGDAPLTIHCGVNPNPTAANMAQIVAIEGPPAKDPPLRKPAPSRR
jgi:hypothetical protein